MYNIFPGVFYACILLVVLFTTHKILCQANFILNIQLKSSFAQNTVFTVIGIENPNFCFLSRNFHLATGHKMFSSLNYYDIIFLK